MVPDDVCEGLAIDRFLDGLRETQQAVQLARPSTLNEPNESLTQALEFEAVKQSVGGHVRVWAATAESLEKAYSVDELVQKVVGAYKISGRSYMTGTVGSSANHE